ncbi:hypothetical protein, partial [Desertihabitans aurantiacus]|uniref:hypothetical protein n=1 Tax=Desertihabitans aurantiacus TaxID=2282477 RepID=UPI0018E50A1F
MPGGLRWDGSVAVLVLAVAAVGGGVVGSLAAPSAVPAVLTLLLLQLAGTAVGWWRTLPPVVTTGVVAALTLLTGLVPELGELLRIGAVPWVTLALALGTQRLIQRSRTPAGLVTGIGLLAVAVAVVAAVTVRGGAPVVPSTLAAAVPVLGGALSATALDLARARRDRLARSAPLPATDDGGDRARRALLLVLLRAEVALA